MRIVVVVAMDKELNLLLNQISEYSQVDTMFSGNIYIGEINGHAIFITKSGIGKVNSSMVTSHLINMYKPDLVINSGVAGSLDERMNIGDILVAEKVCYHDVWCGPGTKYGEADCCPVYFKGDETCLSILRDIDDVKIKFGLLCSGDKFIMYPDDVETIKSFFRNGLGCDMESASISHTCFKYNVPCIVVRVMSDRPGSGENISQYNNFWETAPQQTFEIVRKLIEKL